jgi:hypothetical protein
MWLKFSKQHPNGTDRERKWWGRGQRTKQVPLTLSTFSWFGPTLWEARSMSSRNSMATSRSMHSFSSLPWTVPYEKSYLSQERELLSNLWEIPGEHQNTPKQASQLPILQIPRKNHHCCPLLKERQWRLNSTVLNIHLHPTHQSSP